MRRTRLSEVFMLFFVLVCPWAGFRSASLLVTAQEKELFLTPMIKKGELDKARAESVDNIKLSHIKTSTSKEIKSFSGYLTIEEKLNSNLFFWFFPALEKPESAPIVLWVNGIPGYSCLNAVFLENGPFQLDNKNELKDRPFAWTNTHSMLYIDAPVGSGFSFADSEDAYASSSEDEATEVYEALVQFFTLFSEYQGRDFYLAGENYAGTFVPHIGMKIDKENANSKVKINFKGIFMGSAFIDPMKQFVWSEYFSKVGIISEEQRAEMQAQEKKLQDLITNKKPPSQILELTTALIFSPNSTFVQYTGLSENRNIMTGKEPEAISRFRKFIDSKEVHEYLHVGLHKFTEYNPRAFARMAKDYYETDQASLEQLLDKGYKVLIYAAQFDGLIPHFGITEVIKGLKWKGAADFSKASRSFWKVKDDVAGYVKSSGNFHYVLVRNAGNYAIQDQPEWLLDMLTRFVTGKNF